MFNNSHNISPQSRTQGGTSNTTRNVHRCLNTVMRACSHRWKPARVTCLKLCSVTAKWQCVPERGYLSSFSLPMQHICIIPEMSFFLPPVFFPFSLTHFIFLSDSLWNLTRCDANTEKTFPWQSILQQASAPREAFKKNPRLGLCWKGP